MTQARDSGSGLPWYRQLWPWLVMLPPAATVIGGFLTLGLALRHPEYDVRDRHYRDGLGVYRAPDASVPAGADALLLVSPDGRVEVTVSERLNTGELSLWLVHPTTAEADRKIELTPLGGGRFAGSVELLDAAHWTVALRNERVGWRLVGRLESTGQVVRLTAAPDAREAP